MDLFIQGWCFLVKVSLDGIFDRVELHLSLKADQRLSTSVSVELLDTKVEENCSKSFLISSKSVCLHR